MTDNKYFQMEKNTVKAENQLKVSDCVRIINPEGTGKRIMFVGNSITLHGIKEEIGWYIECGMAASKPENDYVHIIMDEVNKIDDSVFCICQLSTWEREYKNGKEKHKQLQKAREFDADIIIMRFVENCPAANLDSKVFKNQYDALLGFLNKSGKAKAIITTGFWRHPADASIIEYAKENKLSLVELGDLGELDEMKAIGLFEHEGVANHPGDIGMKNIAERILKELKNLL